MSHGRNKYQSRENRARIRELFLREWDLVGAAGTEAEDEYDAYIGKAYVMLVDEGASEADLQAYLRQVSTVYMGMSETPYLIEANRKTAKLLFAMRPEFETH